jgi:AraC family transcriptional regulator, regulatory protein of adaptative response / DNA-3-methyladenine glycosylase II
MSENREPFPQRGLSWGIMTRLDHEACYRALVARDERFDGRFFVGVTSTGIYCRPVCPATTAKQEHCRFYTTAAAAQAAGFRPCLRCRPETAPEHGAWRGTSNTVSRGLQLIAAGELDGDEASAAGLAERLGVGERHLRRLFRQHLGASPIAVAQTRRVLFAKQLIHETCLPMSEVALASGFGSVRRFNEIFQQMYGKPPSALRRKAVVSLPEGSAGTVGVTVCVRYRRPYDWPAMLAHLRARAIEGVEHVDAVSYQRTFREDGEIGTVEIRHLPEAHSLAATLRSSSVRTLARIVNRIRRVFDVGADIAGIGAHLADDPLLAPLVAERPGLRVPGGWNGFELAVRATLGQQVSVGAGRQLAEKLARMCGTPTQMSQHLTLVFPTPEEVAGADLSKLGIPNARSGALLALARAAQADPRLFEPLGTIEETVARLCAIRGIGAWTAHYIALRAVREPDAFPAGDRGLQRGFAVRAGAEVSAEELGRRAERWRPWRAYAAQHLWAADGTATRESKEVSP